MNKPITETHPAFAHIWAMSVGLPLDGQSLKEAVQKTTVDVAEHEAVKQEVEHYKSELAHANVEYGEIIDKLHAEVERLKKELIIKDFIVVEAPSNNSDCVSRKVFVSETRKQFDNGYIKGVLEGERRMKNMLLSALEIAKAHTKDIIAYDAQRNNLLYPSWYMQTYESTLREELGLGDEESTDNTSYPNASRSRESPPCRFDVDRVTMCTSKSRVCEPSVSPRYGSPSGEGSKDNADVSEEKK